MSDFIFLGATIVFFATCALYIHWCDKIIGPDDFPLADAADRSFEEAGTDLVAAVTAGNSDVNP
jgi:hypothetical protein